MKNYLSRLKKKKILKIISESNKILIVSHLRPDGDSIGSQIALYIYLKERNKKVYICNYHNVPHEYLFLKYIHKIKSIKHIKQRTFDTIISLDSSGIDRYGFDLNIFEYKTLINIDHHISNTLFGNINFVYPEASSTSEILFYLLYNKSNSISEYQANAFLLGIITDTGLFKFSNVSLHTIDVVYKLLKNKASINKIANEIYMKRPIEKVKLISKTIERIKMYNDIAISYITNKDFIQLNAKTEYTDGIVNEILYINNVSLAILIIEDNKNIRISFRSKNNKYNVNKLANRFGGGGHRSAAGCYIENINYKQAIKIIKKEIEYL